MCSIVGLAVKKILAAKDAPKADDQTTTSNQPNQQHGQQYEPIAVTNDYASTDNYGYNSSSVVDSYSTNFGNVGNSSPFQITKRATSLLSQSNLFNSLPAAANNRIQHVLNTSQTNNDSSQVSGARAPFYLGDFGASNPEFVGTPSTMSSCSDIHT